nr:cation transporter [Tessaracoccus sp. SD287]
MLNFAYFFVEFSVALTAGSVSLLADSVDFLEDTAINLLILVALGWSLARRATLGKLMTLVLLTPAILAGWKAIEGFANPIPHWSLPSSWPPSAPSRSMASARYCCRASATTADR